MFFDSWSDIVRVVVVGALAYSALVFLLRVFGKRTLAKMNAFDFIVTVAFGSILASTILSKETSLIEGVLAFALLALLQYILAWLSVRSKTVQHLVKAEPTLLLFQGELLPDALRNQRVAAEEVRAAVRQQGIAQLEELEAVILETNGDFSVIRRTEHFADSIDTDVPEYKPKVLGQ
ncbi:MAG: DUF421 domain-containing protein [Caldilineaceae bacterium]